MLNFTTWHTPSTGPGAAAMEPVPVQPRPADSEAVWRELFLARLRQLAERRQMLDTRAWPLPHAARLLDLALFSTYQDCVALNGRQPAEEILRAARNDSRPRASGQPAGGDVGTATGMGDADGIGGTSGAVAHGAR